MNIKFSTSKIIALCSLAIFSFSCGNNPLDIDVSNIAVQLEVKHFEKDLFASKGNITSQEVEQLHQKYGVFFQDFTQNVINIGRMEQPNFAYQLNAFVSDPEIGGIQNDVYQLYSDFTPYQAQLEKAFQHYQYYFPKKKTPQIITYISGFNYAIMADETYLGIGLDMFLGADYKAYGQLGYPQYKINTLTKENLVVGAMTGWVDTEFELNDSETDLLTEMIHQGKILYLLDALMPKTENNLKVSYSQDQLKWCENNAQQIWFYFIDNNLLYTKKTKEIIKYMGEAPFTQGFPEGSPGRVGHWLGWQIVSAYMQKNPTITISQLMNEKDAQNILNKSKYKP